MAIISEEGRSLFPSRERLRSSGRQSPCATVIPGAIESSCLLEARAFVSSANFTEAALVRNVEIGVLIEASEVAGEFVQALNVAGFLLPVPGTRH